MKSENHQWLKDIQYLLCKVGCKNIWLDPYTWSKNSLKSLIKRRLSDINIQEYNQYINDPDNIGKCDILKTCQNDLKYPYGEREYLGHTHSPYTVKFRYNEVLGTSNKVRYKRIS